MNPPTSIKTDITSGTTTKGRIAPHPGGYRIAVEPLSMVVRPRMLTVAVVSTAVTVVLFLTSVGVSDFPLTPVDVARILLGGGTRVENVVVFDVALPRALVALLVGFVLGLRVP